MAKNYTFAEAVKVIAEGKDLNTIADIGRRYPILMQKTAVVAAKAGDDFVDLMSFMPDYLTANKVNTALKAAAGEATEDAGDDDDNTEDVGEETTEATEGAVWNESMSAKELWDVLGKAGKRKLAKSTKKADLIEACKKAFGAAAEAEDAEDEAEDTTEEETTEGNAYDGKSAMELFKECKKRGIKAAPKKPAKFYADLLVKNDAENAGDAESDDEWDEDDKEEVKEEPKKKAPKAKDEPKKAEKPKAKKAESDDDDEWDI